MNVSPYYEQAIRSYSAEDKAFFDRATGFLPKRKETTPYHSGPHSVRSLRMAYELAGRPANVLEIGFCLGHSAALWFAFGAKAVTSVDVSGRTETMNAAGIMQKEFGSRFRFIQRDRQIINLSTSPDFMFIDGDHSIEGVNMDTQLAITLGIQNILFDDYFLHWSDGTQPAIEKFKLVPIAILGTMALCVPAY
jgi:predicted O-methyltransferase YrrM